MKRGRRILLALLVVFAFPVALYAKDASPAAVAKAKITHFTGEETSGELLYPGDFTFRPDGSPRWGRNRLRKYVHDTTDPRVTGEVTVVVHCNFNPKGEGPCWGTMHVEPDEVEGAWEAVWHSPPGKPGILTAIGYGTGELEGQKAWWTFDYSAGTGLADISGRILDPHGE